MRNEIKVFENEAFGKIRTLVIEKEPWFVGKDIAEILGYSNPSKAIMTHVDEEDKEFVMFDIADSQNGNVLSGRSKTAIINESGLYSLILSSKLPKAKEFKRWVTSEVLPSIRKYGGYILNQEQMDEKELLASALVVANKMIEEKIKRLEELKPKGEYYDKLVDVGLNTNFRNTASEFNIPQNTFIEILIRYKFIYRDSKGKILPYSRYKNKGYFYVKEWNNGKFAGVQTLITPQGILYLLHFIEKLFKEINGGDKCCDR